MTEGQPLTFEDKFAIFEQMNLHQVIIDEGWGAEQVQKQADLYWDGGKFTVIDLRNETFEGPERLKQMWDYAHSVFPMDRWFHDMGRWKIEGSGNRATGNWRWFVRWKREVQGIVSTGVYDDVWEKRNGIWKCLERTSTSDPNWPLQIFQPYVDKADETFRAS